MDVAPKAKSGKSLGRESYDNDILSFLNKKDKLIKVFRFNFLNAPSLQGLICWLFSNFGGHLAHVDQT